MAVYSYARTTEIEEVESRTQLDEVLKVNPNDDLARRSRELAQRSAVDVGFDDLGAGHAAQGQRCAGRSADSPSPRITCSSTGARIASAG